jgi:hypothetical protein
MQINFRGQYERALFFKAVRIANKLSSRRLLFMIFTLLISLGALGVLIYRMVDTGDTAGNLVYLAAVVIICGLAVFDLVRPYFAARTLWANPGVRRQLKGQITTRGVSYQFAEGVNEIPWEQFNRLEKTHDLITLIRRDGLLVIFPQSFFKSHADWQNVEKLVTRKIVTIESVKRRR